MKKQAKRWLAMLLSLTMILSLLPATALPAFAAGTVPTDGVTTDVWKQDEQTAIGDDGGGAVCEKTSDGVRLKTGTNNGNSHGVNPTGNNDGNWPAVFVNETANEALAKETGNKFVEFTYVRKAGTDARFGVILNYNSPTDGFFIGFNGDAATNKWFTEEYKTDGDSVWNGLPSGGSVPAAGTECTIRIEWNDTKLISVAQDGETIISDYTFSREEAYTGTSVGFRLAKWSGGDAMTEVTIKEMHYSGQATIPTYDVSGTVKDKEKNTPLAGVTVTAGGSTASTDTNGRYTLSGLVEGTYTLTFQKQGYADTTLEGVEVKADVTGKDAAMEESDLIQIPTDGVKDTWIQVGGSKKGTSHDPALVDGKLVLQASYDNVNNFDLDAPAIFTNDTLDAALAKSTDEEKFLSFTVVPENTSVSSVENEWFGFGIVLDYNGQVGSGVSGYHIGYPSGQTTGWFVQYYGGQNDYGANNQWPGFTGPDLDYGEPLKVEIRWTDETVTLKLNGQSYELPHDGSHGGVPKTNKVAIKVGTKNFTDNALQYKEATKLTLSDIHYSGQETIEARYVKGTVTDGTNPIAGATVKVRGDSTDTYTQTTGSTGEYSVALPIKAEAYTLSAARDGYSTVDKKVTVTKEADKSTMTVNFALTELPTISGTVVDKNGDPILGATVVSKQRPEGSAVVTDAQGRFTIIGAVDGEHALTATAEGYETTTVKVTVNGESVDNVEIKMPDRQIPFYTLSTDDMDVKVAQFFPQVIQYTMKGSLAGKTMYGQTAELKTILINGKAVDLTGKVTSVVDDEDNPTKVTYTMLIDDSNKGQSGVTATITAELRVGLDGLNDQDSAAAGRTLGFYITKVEYAGADAAARTTNRLTNPVQTIEIPNHSLVSVRSTEKGAAMTGAKQAANTVTSGDVTWAAKDYVSDENNNTGDRFFAAFVYNKDLSAGLASNSAYGTSAAGSDNYPVQLKLETKDGGTAISFGLGSTLWYYDYDITNSQTAWYTSSQLLTDAQLPREKRVIEPLEQPYAKVVITGDMNKNNKVDWQDGAIAYRETVMHIPANSETVRDAVNLRISMNFGSMATNPFLIALDNVKRVAAHTDGLGQFVLLKGYAGEGHDSNHPQYDNIGIRMGGKEDMLKLMEEGEKLGATFGIHVNASELYAEAITNDVQVRRDTPASGQTTGALHYGWNWLDQGIAINAVYDYASGLRGERWDALKTIVGTHPFTVYVDVWGNWTSGTEDPFLTRALSEEITSRGWRLAHEWAYANPYESSFQHWTTDFTYGDYSNKGKLNSNVIRFLLNEYKDSFPPDFASYGGVANAPLLGGPAMQGFEGWQKDGEYNLSIYNTFNQMVYTKFLQHYPVVEWTNAEATVKMPYNGGGAGGSRSNSTVSDWLPEAQIRLSDGTDTIIVTRGASGKLVTDFGLDTVEKFLAGETEYRSRVVTLNGKVIVTGAPASAGEDNTFPSSRATLKYLIPWYWDADGDRVDPADEKLYHWNAQGGQSTWELPNGWNVSTVSVYELSDQGRGPAKTVKVIEGKVALTATANTCYVVTKGIAGKAAAPTIEYGDGLYLKDPSFNLDTTRNDNPWTIAGGGSAIHTTNSDGIGVLKMTGAVSVSQQMTGLTAGKKYVSYVAVDNRSNAKASITIKDQDGNVVATNYTTRSIAKNYVSSYYLSNTHGVEAGGSYFQNMFVYFTAQAGKTYTMTLSREAGAGSVYFDDLRTVEYGFNYARADGTTFGGDQTVQSNKGSAVSPVTYVMDGANATSVISKLEQDFENVPQGIWPFVVGPVEGVNDNRTHVSELNAPFTQAGWDVKKLDDVIDGNWSIKSNGLSGRNSLVYQTIPQNFRFEPNSVYTVSFDYELGTTGSYIAVVGDGAYTGLDGLTVYNLTRTLNTTVPDNSGVVGNTTAKATVGHIEFTVVGSESGQTWIGIYSRDNADNQGTSGAAAAFGGYTDFVLDNLVIELAPAAKNELAKLLREADAMEQDVYVAKDSGDTAAAWAAFLAKRTAGHTAFDKEDATQDEINTAWSELKTAIEALEKVEVSISGTVTSGGKPVEGVVLTLEDEHYIPVGLTVTTGADGVYKFESKSGVELAPATYHIKAQATGYNVTTTDAITATKETSKIENQDISLVAEAPGAYVNDFNDGNISMMGHLLTEEEAEAIPNELPGMEWIEYNGSGALKVTWHGVSGEERHTNNVVDKTVAFANGSASYDVTALTTGVRFNVTLRASASNIRVAIGQQDQPDKWMGEFWNTDGSGYSATTPNDIYVAPGATRNVRVVAEDTVFTVYIDGIQVYTVNTSSGFGNAYGPLGTPVTDAGYIGINMRGNVGSEFIIDNIRIVSADETDGVYNVSGSVTEKDGATIVAGASVDLYRKSDGARAAATTTNAEGKYQVTGVEPGAYTVKVTAPFFVEYDDEINVTNANLTGKDFRLDLDKSSLNALIDEMEALKEADYTEGTWATLAAALEAAEEVAENANATVAALNTAYRDLSNARDGLVASEKATADFTALRNLHKQMANVANDNYTTASWDAFQKAVEEARQMLLAGTATPEEAAAMVTALQDAYGALVTATPPAEMKFEDLQAAYDAAKGVENEDYTDESWAAFEAAREKALGILSNADGLTQDEVDAAAAALTAAQAALTKKSSGDSGTSVAPIVGGGSDTNTTTTTNPDGTVTTTVTDKKTGTVTATTEKPDGSTEVVETKADGTVTETTIDPEGGKVEKVTSPEEDVTITVTDKDGEELAKVAIPAVIPEPETRFVDVPEGHWADEAIHNMAALDVVHGVGNNTYNRNGDMKRGDLALMLSRMSSNEENSYELAFADVPAGKYYASGVAWAAKTGVVTGRSADTFDPENTITREELAVMLYRYAKLLKLDTRADAAALDSFTDGSNTHGWAEEGMAWCVKNGILQGKGNGILDPRTNVTRAEVAVMLQRFVDLLK